MFTLVVFVTTLFTLLSLSSCVVLFLSPKGPFAMPQFSPLSSHLFIVLISLSDFLPLPLLILKVQFLVIIVSRQNITISTWPSLLAALPHNTQWCGCVPTFQDVSTVHVQHAHCHAYTCFLHFFYNPLYIYSFIITQNLIVEAQVGTDDTKLMCIIQSKTLENVFKFIQRM